MHSDRIGDHVFHYNSDLSGDVHITHVPIGGGDQGEVSVPGHVLREFLGRRLRSEIICDLEQASGADFLDRLFGR